MKKVIIGLVGEIAAGKDTMADYLRDNYGAQIFSFSQPLRDILDILHLPYTRANMSGCGNALRGLFGQDLLSKVIAEEVKNSQAKLIVLPNIRLESDLVYIKKNPGFVLVFIDAKPKIRFNRLLKRRQNADDSKKTWKQFLKDSELSTEIMIRELAKKAPHRLDNDGSKKALFDQIEKLIKKLQP